MRQCKRRNVDPSFGGWWDARLEKSTVDQDLNFQTDFIKQQEILEQYIQGEFETKIPTMIVSPINDVSYYYHSERYKSEEQYHHHFLVPSELTSVYSNISKANYFHFKNMIDLPTELAALQLLQNGRFGDLFSTNWNIDEQLQLFRLEQVDQVSIDEMNKLFSYNLLDWNCEKIINDQIEISSEVIQKIRK